MDLTDEEKRREFGRAMARIPIPIECFSDGAACPWCGWAHTAPSFVDWNDCNNCHRGFLFGYPEWSESKAPVSYVPFPWREWYTFGERVEHMEDWKPNDRLKEIYFNKTEERLGVCAEDNGVN